MKVVVSGGTGFIGRALCRSLVRHGIGVTALSRNLLQAKTMLGPSIKVVEWDGVGLGPWEHELDSATAIINLAGEGHAAVGPSDLTSHKPTAPADQRLGDRLLWHKPRNMVR